MVSGPEIEPAALERLTFELVRRGYEPLAVQRELQRAAAAIRELQREVATLQTQLNELDGAPAEQLQARRVAEALGAEATQVLDAAHVAAVERGERAEREAEAVRAQATAEADTSRREAMDERDRIVAAAAQEAEQIVEDGRQRGREMVNEAQVVRERMLGDLARKRQTGRAQVEQLRAGRDRLLESLVVAQQSLDEAVRDLVDAVPEARGAAERAGLRIANEPTPTVEVMEAEIESARLVGHPLVEGVPDPGAPDTDGSDEPDPAFVTGEMEALTHVDAALEGAADVVEGDAPDADADGESDDETGSDDGAELFDQEEDAADDGGTDADDIFARLRESRSDDDAVEDTAEEATEAADDAESEPAPEADPEAEAEDAPELDPHRKAVDRAVSDAVRAAKKVLVEEQGILLEGIRVNGGEAISDVVEDEDAHAEPYEGAVEPALRALVEALGGTVGDDIVGEGFTQIRTVALAPVRHRLQEVAAESDDPDELTDTVRGLYRESRSRRLPAAVTAAVAAVRGAVTVQLAAGDVR